MATYVNNLRLKEIATGDESGTWGTSTNTNLELIGEGFGYGTEQVAADANETFTMADGVADGVRGMYLKFTSAGSLTATRELTLAPNTVSKVWIIENATTGSQIITIKQGAGATVNVASGARALVYTDGAGSGAAVFTADPSLVGLQNLTAGADIASATATDLTAATGNTVVITGTAASTSLTMNTGQQMILLPSAAWPLTYHATTMNINGGVSYTCAAGDRIYAAKDLAGVIRVSVFKQDGTALVPGAASSVAVGDITGAGTGVLTALAVNVGSAGAPVVLGGALGTPSGGTLTNATGLPISTGVSGAGTGVLTALAVNVGSAGAPVVLNGALGTPSSGTATNLTGLPPAGVTGTAAILGANTFTALQTLAAGADIASATATDLTGATGNTVVITGTTTATSLTMTAGQQMVLIAAAAWPLTYHATTMNITGGIDYTCAAGDRLYVTKDVDNVIRVSVLKQDGTSVVAAAGGGMQSMQIFTASGTWTKPADITKIYVLATGGGGAGGGRVTGYTGAGGAGSAAGYCEEFIDVSAIASETVTIGANGIGVLSDTGTNGGDTTFGSHLTASGGIGNDRTGVYNTYAGGAATGGDINIPGQYGGMATGSSTRGGPGGSNLLGIGGVEAGQQTKQGGFDGTGYGSGGGGCYGASSGTATGGDGAPGIIIVKEYS